MPTDGTAAESGRAPAPRRGTATEGNSRKPAASKPGRKSNGVLDRWNDTGQARRRVEPPGEIMSLALIIVVMALITGGVVTGIQAKGQRWRWGWREVTTPPVGDGIYRSAPVTVREPRAVPLVCTVAAVTSAAWGILTLFVFMPAGMLGCTVGAPTGGNDLLSVIGFVGIVLVNLHAFFLGTALLNLVKPLTRRSPGAAALVGRTARSSLAHHAVVVAAFAASFGATGALEWIWLAGVPCAIGGAHVALLFAARTALVRLDREDAARPEMSPIGDAG
jgi:hypothetical protein